MGLCMGLCAFRSKQVWVQVQQLEMYDMSKSNIQLLLVDNYL